MTQREALERLLPCPFCGSPPYHTIQNGSVTRSGTLKHVWCKSCGAQSDEKETEKSAIDAWNTRTALAESPAGEGVKESDGGRESRPAVSPLTDRAKYPDGTDASRLQASAGVAPGPSDPSTAAGAEPVAWLVTAYDDDGKEIWRGYFGSGEKAHVASAKRRGDDTIVTPLYAHPPAPVGMPGREAVCNEVIKCPNCHHANEYGDYEGPACNFCDAVGFVRVSELKSVATKKIYVLPLRTIVEVEARFANCVRELLNATPPQPEAPARVTEEQIARIIDPLSFKINDGKTVWRKGSDQNRCDAAMVKARAILALLPTPPQAEPSDGFQRGVEAAAKAVHDLKIKTASADAGRGYHFNRTLDEAVSAIRALSLSPAIEADQWRDIASKPPFVECEERGVYTDDGARLFYFKPTHWRPLPLAPSRGVSNGE